MFKMTPLVLLVLSGMIWLAVGCVLLPLGLNFIVETLLNENRHGFYPVLSFLSPYVGGLDPAALLLIACALVVGFLKGRYVLAKSVQRSVHRLSTLPHPIPLSQLYPLSYYLLLGSMFLMGYLVRFTPLDVRGGIDVTIGSALISGAFLYFRQAWLLYRRKNAFFGNKVA